MGKKFLILTILLITLKVFTSIPASAQDESAKSEQASQVARLESILSGLKQGRKEMQIVYNKANKYLLGNVAKAGVKGAIDTYDALGIRTPGHLMMMGLEELLIEPTMWGAATKQKATAANLGGDASQRYKDLTAMYGVMNEMLKTKTLDRYDSDQPPYKYTSTWWSPPNFKKDGWLEEVTRRHYVIKKFSQKILQVTDREIEIAEAELARLKKEKPPGKAGLFEKTFVNGECQVFVRATDVELLAEKEEINGNSTVKWFYLSSPGSKVEASIKMQMTLMNSQYGSMSADTSREIEGAKNSQREKLVETGVIAGPQTAIRNINRPINFTEKDEYTIISGTILGPNSSVFYQIWIIPADKVDEGIKKLYK